MTKYQSIDITRIVKNLMYGDLDDLDARIEKFKKSIKDILVKEKGHANTRFTYDAYDDEPTTFYLKLDRPKNAKEIESDKKTEAFYEQQERNTLKYLLSKYGTPEECP